MNSRQRNLPIYLGVVELEKDCNLPNHDALCELPPLITRLFSGWTVLSSSGPRRSSSRRNIYINVIVVHLFARPRMMFQEGIGTGKSQPADRQRKTDRRVCWISCLITFIAEGHLWWCSWKLNWITRNVLLSSLWGYFQNRLLHWLVLVFWWHFVWDFAEI